MQRPACKVWADTRPVQSVWAVRSTRPDHDVVDDVLGCTVWPAQGLARIRPPIGMGVMGVVDCKIIRQARCKILGRMEIAAREKPTG